MPGNTEWALYSNLHHRLALLDSPDPDGWTPEELAVEYGVTASTVKRVLKRLVENGHALVTNEKRYIGA